MNDPLVVPSALDLWQQTSLRMQSVTDVLGKPIDAGIFETVVVLNVLNIPTVMSCEGHLDHGVAAPWVDIEPPEVGALRDQLLAAQRDVYPDQVPGAYYPVGGKAKEISNQMKAMQLKLLKKLIAYLDEFYDGRSVSYDICLIAHPWGKGGQLRIESIGAQIQGVETEDIRSQKLGIYQEEMLSAL